MSFDWGAFTAGAADTTLKSWETRDAAERKKQEMLMLEQLRRDTSDYEFIRNVNEEKKQVKRNEFDPATGETVGYNQYGEEVKGTRRLDKLSQEEYESNKQKAALDKLNIQSQIDNRAIDNDMRRAELAERRADRAESRAARQSGGGTGAGGAVTDTDRADALLSRYSHETKQAVKSNNISEAAVRLAAIEFARNSKTGAEAETGFLRFLSDYQAGRKRTDQAKRDPKSLDSFDE